MYESRLLPLLACLERQGYVKLHRDQGINKLHPNFQISGFSVLCNTPEQPEQFLALVLRWAAAGQPLQVDPSIFSTLPVQVSARSKAELNAIFQIFRRSGLRPVERNWGRRGYNFKSGKEWVYDAEMMEQYASKPASASSSNNKVQRQAEEDSEGDSGEDVQLILERYMHKEKESGYVELLKQRNADIEREKSKQAKLEERIKNLEKMVLGRIPCESLIEAKKSQASEYVQDLESERDALRSRDAACMKIIEQQKKLADMEMAGVKRKQSEMEATIQNLENEKSSLTKKMRASEEAFAKLAASIDSMEGMGKKIEETVDKVLSSRAAATTTKKGGHNTLLLGKSMFLLKQYATLVNNMMMQNNLTNRQLNEEVTYAECVLQGQQHLNILANVASSMSHA